MSIAFTLTSNTAVSINGFLPSMIGGGSGGVPIVFEPYNVWVVTAVDSTGRVNAERIIGRWRLAPQPIQTVTI